MKSTGREISATVRKIARHDRSHFRKQIPRPLHLSADADTATNVGSRHGTPVILIVHAAEMVAAGHAFYRSENGVWLTDAVPAGFIDFGKA